MVQCSEPWLLVERPVKETEIPFAHSAPMAAPTYIPEFRLHL